MHTNDTSLDLDLELAGRRNGFNEAELAAVAFLARYSGRTLDAYRHDLRSYFTWAATSALEVLAATRPHVELYRHHMEQRGLAASTIDRRLSTVCGFYRFAHIDGRITSNPAQYVRRPKVHPSEGRGLDRAELGRFLFTAERVDRQHAALAVLLGLNGLRVSEACRHQHRRPRLRSRAPHAQDHRQGQQTSRHPARPTDRAHDRPRRSIGRRAGIGVVHPHMLRAAFIMAALDVRYGCETYNSRRDTQTRERQRSMTAGVRTSTATPRTSSSRSSQVRDRAARWGHHERHPG